MEALRYVVLSLVLGGLCVWGSENLFWMMPPTGLTPLDFCLTVVAYSIAAAVALSAVIWAGLGGITAAFLGGCIMGMMSEGVIVGTMYQGFPFQLVWTPLAWHGVLTGGVLLGLGRARLPLGYMALIWVAFGLAAAYWAQFWVEERHDLAGSLGFAFYILGLGLLVPLAHLTMDRLAVLPRPRTWVLCVAPVFATLVWLAQGVADPNPLRLALPVMLAAILWLMRRLGGGGPVMLGQGPALRHGLFLLAPALTVLLAPLGWAQGWGTLGANWVVAIASCATALIWLGRLALRAVRRAV